MAFRDLKAEFDALDYQVVGISPDPLPPLHEFKEKNDLPFLFLSDEGAATAQSHGVWVEKTNYGRTYMGIARSTFVVGPDGVLRAVFFNVDKSQCLKCHHLAGKGERIGPDLTGVGSRFARIHLIESILEPSRSITPSYQTWLIIRKNGRQLSGVKVAETDRTLTIGDTQGNRHELKKSDIDEQRPLPQSTMPDGLEKHMTTDEFVDLIAFLASRKEGRDR